MKIKLYILTIFAILSIIGIVSANSFYYDTQVYYNKGYMKFNSVNIDFANNVPENFYSEDNYTNYFAIVKDNSLNEIERIPFSLPNKGIYDNVDPNTGDITSGGYQERTEFTIELYIPYHENSKIIEIIDAKNNEITREDVSEFSKNTQTSANQNKDSHGCDINSNMFWCDIKNKCIDLTLENCIKEDIVTRAKDNSSFLINKVIQNWIVYLVILIILVAILIFFLRRPTNYSNNKKKR